ncbi:ob-fold nucleic acid binding domain-containing protein [Diaporthe eres]|nr:ob-fold nucleic acid binding domain-containing protein [Diaporthe eres]
MIEKDEHPVYPQYCFHLSPTINRFCPLRSGNIESLTTHPGFAGQDVFFHRNLPLRWVRIAGMVVAVDEFPHRRVYTVDDSDGLCIECVADVSKLDSNEPAKPATATIPKDVDVDVGSVVDVKGGLALFRGNKQIKIEKMTVLRSTDEEVVLWEKARQFRGEVLDKPWKLTDREVRRCRKEAERQD